MHKVSARLGALVLALVFVVALPTQALAAPVKLDDTAIFVQFWPEGETSTNVVIVGAELDSKVPLPATVQLPLPDGATVFWAGEVIGPDASSDIQRDFKLVDGVGGKLVEFTAETTRAVQFDATIGAVEIKGDDILTELNWTQSAPSKSVSFAVRVPAAVEDVRITPEAPGEPQMNSVGETLYTLADQVLEPGEESKVEVAYKRAGTATTSEEPQILPILLGLLVVAVLALVVAFAVQKRKGASDTE